MSYFVFFYYNHFFYKQFENLMAVRERVSEDIYMEKTIRNQNDNIYCFAKH